LLEEEILKRKRGFLARIAYLLEKRVEILQVKHFHVSQLEKLAQILQVKHFHVPQLEIKGAFQTFSLLITNIKRHHLYN